MTQIKKDVFKSGDTITKKLGIKSYDNELLVYKKKLSYTPKLLKNDDKKRTIKITYECCMKFSKLPKKERELYYPKIKKLFYRFKRDTGFYHGDLAMTNVLVNPKSKKITFVDFTHLTKNKDEALFGMKHYKPNNPVQNFTKALKL